MSPPTSDQRTEKLGAHWFCRSADIRPFITATTWSKCHVTLWLGTPALNHCPIKFGDHSCFENVDTKVFLCYVITLSKDHLTSARCGGHNCRRLDTRFSSCHVTMCAKTHMTWWLWSLHLNLTTVLCLVALGLMAGPRATTTFLTYRIWTPPQT